jgi:hypothetical protein
MSMGTGEPDTTETTPDASVDARLAFPRLELPAVPDFAAAAADADVVTEDDLAPHLDEPAGTWQPPFPPALDPESQYRALVDRVTAYTEPIAAATAGAVIAPAPIADPEPAPVPDVQRTRPMRVPAVDTTTTVPELPELAPAPQVAPLTTSVVAIAGLVLLAAFLVWASRMAFSPALLALSGLLLAQLAAAATASGKGGALPFVAGIPALGLAVSAAKGALGGFSDMAMVAGLFVIAAGGPTLLVLGIVQFVLHRRAGRAGAAETVLREGWKLRVGVAVAIVAAGVYVRDSFAAAPDALLTFGIVALVLFTLVPVARGTAATTD